MERKQHQRQLYQQPKDQHRPGTAFLIHSEISCMHHGHQIQRLGAIQATLCPTNLPTSVSILVSARGPPWTL
jgi:hypothetical protein